jgi:hypothetical protein
MPQINTGRRATSYRTHEGLLQHRCARCHEWQPADLEHFMAATRSKHGLGAYCRTCNAERTRDYARSNRRKYIASIRAAHKRQFAGQGLVNRHWVVAGTVYIEAFNGEGRQFIGRIDSADLKAISSENTKWYVNPQGYLQRLDFMSGRTKLLHSVILRARTGHKLHVDHANGDKLDNRRSNLRVVPASMNALNRRNNDKNTSGYRGVTWYKRDRSWRVQIRAHGKSIVRQFGDDYFAACRFAHDTYLALGVPAANVPPVPAEQIRRAA